MWRQGVGRDSWRKNYFNVFSYAVLEGSGEKALTDKTSVLISDGLGRQVVRRRPQRHRQNGAWNKDGRTGNYQVAGYLKSHPTTQRSSLILFFLLTSTGHQAPGKTNGSTAGRTRTSC
jgi:hypothetical protein